MSVDWAVALKADQTLLAWGFGAVVSDPRLVGAVAKRAKFSSIGGRGALLCLVDLAGVPDCIAHHSNPPPPSVKTRVLQIDASSPRGAVPACVLGEAGGARALDCGRTNKGRTLPRLTGEILDVAVGDDHVCVLRKGHQVECVGDDLFGRVTGRSLFANAGWP